MSDKNFVFYHWMEVLKFGKPWKDIKESAKQYPHIKQLLVQCDTTTLVIGKYNRKGQSLFLTLIKDNGKIADSFNSRSIVINE